MPKKSSISQEILQYVPCKCCRVRHDKGDVYRVYKYHSLKLPSGKWSSDYGYLIGKIIPEKGFIPNKRYRQETGEQSEPVFSDAITDVSYGKYALLKQLSNDILQQLETCFGAERGTQIYAYALILCANGFLHMDQIDDYYQESFLSLLYKNYSFKLGTSAISTLLHELGKRGNPIRSFEQYLIDNSSGNIAIDGHVIRSCSNENDLSEPGYKTKQLKAPQVNLLIAYDTQNNIPLMYRTYRGSSIDKKSVLELLESRSFKKAKFVVDRGFYSAKVLGYLSSNGNTYIIPLPANNKNYKRIKETLQFTSGEFVYSTSSNTARILYYEERLDNNLRIIVYKDVDENNSKRKSYMHAIANGEDGYTQQGYDEYCDTWGIYYLQTNTEESAAEVYGDYKARWSIETFNNYIKNDANFNDLKIQDYYVQHGFDFIMLVTGLIHSRLSKAVKELNKSNISTFDILTKAGMMRMVHYEKEWKLHNTRTKDLELLKLMGFTPALTFTEPSFEDV